MPKMTKRLSKRRDLKNGCSFVRMLVIVLSFLSLISRVIYCTYATWLTITSFDCHPCPNTTSPTNSSTHLFVSQHSSASFRTVRNLDVNTGADSVLKSRAKRSNDLVDLKESQQLIDNYSQFFTNSDSKDIKQKAQKIVNEAFKRLDIDWNAEENQTESKAIAIENKRKSIQSAIDGLFANISSNGLSENGLQNQTQSIISEIINDFKIQNETHFKDSDALVIPLESSSDDNIKNETYFQNFTNDSVLNIVEDLIHNITSVDNRTKDTNALNHSSDEWSELMNSSSNEDNVMEGFTMTILLNELLNASDNRQPKNLNDDQLINDTSYRNSINDILMTDINVCSQDCSQFLSIELSDPSVRKWATIVITGVLYLYAFVMFSIFIGSVLAIVDLLVIATFIEGAKLFAGFVLIIIDSFNGKEVHFNLIDVKFNVQSGGNGWTADFSYSEYLLDIIIFFLSTLLCIRVFKCFEKRTVISVEDLAETRGTYRSNNPRHSLEPIFENH